MSDITSHAVWKGLCRILESKPFVRRFGIEPLRQLDSYAIFEISPEQDSEIDATRVSLDDEHPIPPLPFPKMVLLLAGYAIMIEQPEMDLDRSVLEFRSMLYMPMVNEVRTHEHVSFATIRLDVGETVRRQEFAGSVVDVRSQSHLQGGTRVRNFPEDSNDPFSHEEELLRRDVRGLQTPAEQEHVAELVRRVRDQEERYAAATADYAQACFSLSLKAIAWINRPKHFIVEQGPEVLRKPGKGDQGRVRRLGERSRHIILSHDDVRRRWTDGNGTHASPMPHLRRGHFKTLRAERFGENRGKVVWVSPSHVNGACVEWRQGAVSYKVVG